MKRRKVVAMLLAGTLTLSQPLAVFASEDFISDITSEQSGMDTEPDAIAEDTGSSDDAQGEGLPMDNSVNSAQGLINNDETGTADIPQNADVSCDFDDGAGNSTTDDTNEGIVEEASGAVDQTVIKNPSCQVALSNGSLIDMEVSNDAGEIQSDYRLDVREVLGDQKKNEEDALNSTYNDNKKGSSAMFDLKVKDGQDNDVLLSSPSLITLSSTDFSFLDNSVLYHKKNDGTWEQLEYTQFHDEEKNIKHITFTVNDAYGTFVFAKEAETSENNKKEVHETGPESTETTDTADTDNITTDEPASTPEKSDSNKDLSVVEQINNFSWKGGIGGQDLSINVTSETAYPETDTLQVTEGSEDKIKAGTDVIAKVVGKNVSVDLATNINICKTDGEAELGNGVYHVDFDGVAITEDTLLYHELKDNQWEKVPYEKTSSGIEFSLSDGFGDFIFLKTEKDEAKEDKKDNSDESSKTYSYEDDDVAITATANSDAGFPDGAELYAEKLQEGTDAYNTAMSEVEKSVKIGNNQKLFYIPYDVYFINNGEKIEPEKGKVKVKMAFKDALFGTSPKPDETFVAHIKDDGTLEQITNSSKEKDTVVFGVDSFSIMGPAIVTEADNTGSEGKDSVTPVIIDKFNASFVSGATLTDGKYVWNPSDSASGHMFVYRIDYTMSGTFSTDKGAFKIEVPLHILKDRNGNWADTFDCPYILESELSSDDNSDFVYSVDEENNKAIIYNYKPYPTGEAGYIEVSYSTSKNTMNYVDMGGSTEVHAKVYATNDASTVTAEADAVPVYIDTHATISYTQKKAPTLYSKWNDSWGEKPEGADNYLYLVWPIRTYINKNTSMYNFYLDDTFSSLEGSVVGYRFAGQDKYTETNHVDNVSSYGDRYDYVLTRHSKSLAEEKVQSDLRYEVHNDVVATVDPIDQVDEDTIARSSLDWWYEAPKYEAPTGHFWAEKEGIYGKRNVVRSSEDVSDYTLAEFCAGDEDTIDNLKYHTYGNAYPYPWTLADGATGTVDDATNGLYGTKKVNYQFTDDTFYLEGTRLNNEDYELTNIEWTPTVNDVTFNPNSYTFVETPITNYSDEDNITIWVRWSDDSWKQAATYNLQRKDYENVDDTLIKSAAGENVAFTKGVKGVRFTASNAYYHTRFELYPIVSLNRTDNVLAIIGTDKSKVRLKNEANFVVTQNKDILFERTVDGTDYIQKVKRESEIKKDIIQTKNVKRKSSFDITWRVDFGEKYVDNNGVHYILQESGKFYDLLPAGSILDTSSITVNASGEGLGLGEYTYETIDNFKNSGRTMLVVSINNETNSRYIMTYKTSHTYDSINDYGKNVLNSVAYESGNEKIGEGLPDNGGEITDKSYMTDLDEATDANKFKYAEARYNINILFAASTGLKKQIKNSTSTQYSYDTTVHLNEDYSYQVRLVNDASTKSKNVIFFDSLENFYQKAEETSPTKVSDWKGTLTGINVNNLLFKNISPAVYLSKIDSMNIQNHHDLSETVDSDAVWLPYDEFIQKYGIDKATAIAIDASKCVDGSDYVMNEKESISFDIYMKAPGEDKSGKTDPIAYNNIYVERTAMVVSDNGSTEELPQFYHQDYTKAHYRVSGDLKLKKVDETDMKTPISGITYRLAGTSDYGTDYNEERVSDKNGGMEFLTIEKGTYLLQEINCSDDWQLNTESYTVTINEKGKAIITNLTKAGDSYIVSDKPRIHANLLFIKRNSVTSGSVKNAKFRLSGTSDYGNDYLLYETSGDIGRVYFENIELGTYELAEVEAPDGYIQKKEPWKVKVDERGVAVIYDGEKEEEKDTNGYYVVKNEPYHSIRFLKSSTYGDNIYLEGAEFSLTGISDYGTSVDKTAVSGKAEDGGLVVFDRLEPGTYILKETKAPEDHDLDEKPYTVVVKKDGTFTIDGLKKVRFGSGTKTISESIAENTAELEEESLTENVKITTKNDTNIMDELSKNTDTESSKS